MKTQENSYETPVLTPVGAFSAVTLGVTSWGWDDSNHCWYLNCPDQG
ncbi:lasso RiPP family leader peptide-containing protein [Actinomadura sp. WMMB 499]|nr:lasso RiPP family leader peptide-containing protein [Actinomadura sp. WMMB 499]QFG20279.1 lasso RiPP family leader peptide-containing protein [Actinomadura sp. WMMB 499]